jgi:hypothetical protein
MYFIDQYTTSGIDSFFIFGFKNQLYNNLKIYLQILA